MKVVTAAALMKKSVKATAAPPSTSAVEWVRRLREPRSATEEKGLAPIDGAAGTLRLGGRGRRRRSWLRGVGLDAVEHAVERDLEARHRQFPLNGRRDDRGVGQVGRLWEGDHVLRRLFELRRGGGLGFGRG